MNDPFGGDGALTKNALNPTHHWRVDVHGPF